MQYWLLKTEPTTFSIDDLQRKRREPWNGVRNFQARNYLRSMKKGDLVLIHHSSIAEPHVAGVGKVVSAPYPDPTQFDTGSPYYDARATKEKPYWTLVDVGFVQKFKSPVYLKDIKQNSKLKGMILTQPGTRLSVQPVSKKHFEKIVSLGSGDVRNGK